MLRQKVINNMINTTKNTHESAIRFGYVPNGRKEIFQDYRFRDADNH